MILIISDKESDLSQVLTSSSNCRLVSFLEAEKENLNGYKAIAVLCGTNTDKPKILSAALRIKIEDFCELGKPVFFEWCASFGYSYTVGDDYNDGSNSMGDAMCRYVYIGKDKKQLCYGDLVYAQANCGCSYRFIPNGAYPILYNGGHILKHDHIDKDEIDVDKIESKDWRLWYYDKTRLVCSFKISNFVKARFVPFASWCDVISIIAKHLGVENVKMPKPHYTLGNNGDTNTTFNKALNWFTESDMLIDNGINGAMEGMSHPILPTGKQIKRTHVRVDCVGEIAGAYFFDYLLNGDENSLIRYKNLSNFIFDKMQIKSGKFKGLLRWTETAWCTAYGDDVARAILGTLFYIMYTGDTTRLKDIEQALDLLISLTGTDGLITHGLYCFHLSDEYITKLTTNPSNQYCAHMNAYYSACLLLAYRLNNKQIYLDTAVKGLTAIMKVYPNTIREISETEELCRLIFPLACLYQTTKCEEHKKWLYDVCDRLELYRYKTGGYVEMDPGYTAFRSRTSGTESSMLADNGNEIAELLYSLNWLPLGFAYAYYVTDDVTFLNKWEDICKFFANSQIVSQDKTIDGAWSRCLDLKRMEIYGMPHDVGWGPCCIESGWTVAEIAMGLGFGMAIKNKKLPTI